MKRTITLFSVLLIAWLPQAFADDESTGRSFIEEIVVTAEKRAERLAWTVLNDPLVRVQQAVLSQ